MDSENKARIVLNLISPVLFFLIPIFLYIFFSMPNPQGVGHLDWKGYAIIGILCIGGWFFSVIYLLSLFGVVDWLKRKK